MARDLRFTHGALLDLEAVRRWQTQPGAAALRKLTRIRASVRDLREAPCRHPVGTHAGVRELPAYGHRVMYIVQPDTGRNDTAGDILVLRVFGPGQRRAEL